VTCRHEFSRDIRFHSRGEKGRTPLDRTRVAVTRQLRALGCTAYEVGVRRPDKGGFQQTVFKTEHLAVLGWLKHRNAQGCHIYIRPACAHTLILLDDLNFDSVHALKKDRLEPAAVVETSPDNFQVWLKLAAPAPGLPHPLATYLAKWLTSYYQCDPNSADWRHYGRLAGFTNRKPTYRDSRGYYPYVLIREWRGGQIPMTTPLLKEALDSFKAQDTKDRDAVGPGRGLTTPIPTSHSNIRLEQLYREYMERIFARSPGKPWIHCPDWSRLDFMIAGDLHRAGYDPGTIYLILEVGSPELEKRKAGHVEDYLQRTLAKVMGQAKARESENSLTGNIASHGKSEGHQQGITSN